MAVIQTSGQPVLSVVVPCYNSADYMDHCLETLLVGAEDVEIIVVDDGSTRDNTAAKADAWAERHPDTIRVIHQENKGHGGAVMAGLRAARGVYLFELDSDDWVDRDAFSLLLTTLRRLVGSGRPVDLMIANYVYEHTYSGTRRVMKFGGALPKNRPFTWDDIGRFAVDQKIAMHSLIYRTQVVRDSGLELPEHLFYVDNLYAYVPLPYVKTAYYLPVDLYRYFIGRDDQSVNADVFLGRIDQQYRITSMMIDAVKLPEGAGNPKLAAYMAGYLSMIVAISAALAVRDGSPAALERRRAMWEHIEATDPGLRARLGWLPRVASLPGRWGRWIVLVLWRYARRVYRFN